MLQVEELAQQLPAVLALRDRAALSQLLAPDVRWGGREDTEQTCHNRQQATDYYEALVTSDVHLDVLRTRVISDDRVFVHLGVRGPDGENGEDYETQLLLTVSGGLITDIMQLEEDAPMVELLAFSGCHHYEAFLPHLQQLLSDHDINSSIQLVEVMDEKHAQHLHFLGSPSLRINGLDVEPGAEGRTGYGMQCRIYDSGDGLRGVPADALLLQALRVDGGPGAP